MTTSRINSQLPRPNAQGGSSWRVEVGSWRFFASVAAMLSGGSATVLACPVCFGAAENNGLIDGAKLGVIVLVAVTMVVQGAFVAFFLYLRRRARRMADDDLETEWFELQRGSRPS